LNKLPSGPEYCIEYVKPVGKDPLVIIPLKPVGIGHTDLLAGPNL
jgi:hypothetical protein